MFRISLKAARVNASISQKNAAKNLGISTKTLQNYENGSTAIPGYVLKKAALLYRISEEYIDLPNVEDGKYDDIFFESITV